MLHSICTPEIILPNEDECILEVDAASLYPTLLIEWNFAPKHLGQSFLKTYSKIKKERIEAKRNGNKIKNETLKLTLNSVTGLMQNEYSWLYSPEDVMRIRMNGQLILLMLAENLILNTNCRVFNYNTDGLYLIVKKDQLPNYNQTVEKLEKICKLEFETDEFEAFYQYAINDYFGIAKGYSESKNPDLIKKKGMFLTDITIGKGMPPRIIPETVMSYFLESIPPREYLKSCTDLRKFLTYQKVGKQFDVYHGNKKLVHINRFYYSTTEPYLLKWDDVEKRLINMNTKSGVHILNKLVDTNIPKDLNYDYYLYEINKIIGDFVYKQLTLF